MDNLRDIVFQALGQVSMCWSERPKGVFDSVQAGEIGEALLAAIEEDKQKAIVQAQATWLLSHPLIIRDTQGHEIARSKSL